jgi:hypothetical protein
MDSTERSELIAALHKAMTSAEGLLRHTELLLCVLEANSMPSAADLAESRRKWEPAREHGAILRQGWHAWRSNVRRDRRRVQKPLRIERLTAPSDATRSGVAHCSSPYLPAAL